MSVRKDMTPFTLVLVPRSRRHLDINSLFLAVSNSESISLSFEITDGGLNDLFLRWLNKICTGLMLQKYLKIDKKHKLNCQKLLTKNLIENTRISRFKITY